jgi:tetratricopeptide (TPR) repeat protein
MAHSNLGVVLQAKGQWDEAIAEHKKGIELNPKSAAAHSNLGFALADRGQLDEAIACYKKAIELDPKNALFHNNLADGLKETGDLGGAGGAIDEALRLDPKIAIARVTLAEILLLRGRFAESVPALERAIERLRQTTPAEAPYYESLLPRARRLAEQAETLKSLAATDGDETKEPTALDLAARAREQDRPALAARLAEVALAASLVRANDLKAGYRHNAARDAARAGTGSGHDDPGPDEAAKTELRHLALEWLRADLALWTRQLETGPPADRATAQQTLRHWQQDSDLAGLRDEEALAKLPDGEREGFAKLWADVAELLKTAETVTTQEEVKK